MKRLSLIVSAVSAALMLSGCGSLTGFSNAKTDFACADLSGGPSCRNISQVYEENNPTAPVVLAASEEEDFVQPFFEPNQTPGKQVVKTESDSVSRRASGNFCRGAHLRLCHDCSSSSVEKTGNRSSCVARTIP